MVRLTVTVTVTVLLFFFTVSYARNPSNPPEYEVINQDLLNSSPESDANPTSLLVTEKSKSNALQGFDLKPKMEVTDAENPHIENTEEDLPESETLTINEIPLARPLTTLNFHPINRHFRVRRSYPFRLSRHQFNPTSGFGHGPQVRVSYGDSDFDHHPALFHDGRRQILAKWVKFHHNHYRHRDDDDKKQTFLFKKHHMLGKEKFKKHFRYAEEDDREEGGFMNRILKFFNF